MNDRYYMKMALTLAEKGRGYTSPNPMVGAVVVKGGKVVGKGYHQFPGGPHAEVYAIDSAGDLAKDATIYVTLEPCNHFGRTPPCTQKIIAAGIARVVMAMADPNPDVRGGGADVLRDAGIRVDSGVCETEAQKLNEAFIKHTCTKKPFVILKCAATLDGRIATGTGDSKWISGAASRKFVHELRHAVDAILVGIGTVTSDNPQLTTRLEGKECRDPIRVILDTHLSIMADAEVLSISSNAQTWLVTGKNVSDIQKNMFLSDRVQVIACEEKNGKIDLEDMLIQLGERGITSLLVEGGSHVIASFLRAGLVDKLFFFYGPKLLGGEGIPICTGPGPAKMADSLPLKDIHVRRFDDDIMIEGYFK